MSDTDAQSKQSRIRQESRDDGTRESYNAHKAPHAEAVRHRLSRRPSVAPLHSTTLNAPTSVPSVAQEAKGEVTLAETKVLARGVFREADWSGQNFNGFDAHGVDLSAATLTGICALGANFAGGLFEEAQLQGAALCGANLAGANLRHADLRNANLAWCDLRGASLFAADLRGVNLGWADLRDADLRQVNLSGAYYNYQTQWPVGFDPSRLPLVRLAEAR